MEKIDKQRGARIEQLRSNRGISQLELAEMLGYKSDSTISKWEGGTSVPNNAAKLIKLAQALDTTTDYILFGDKAPNIVVGDNHGMNGNNSGTVNINNGSKKADEHQEEAHEMRSDDLEVQEAILERFDKQLAVQHETNKKLDKIINLLSKKEK